MAGFNSEAGAFLPARKKLLDPTNFTNVVCRKWKARATAGATNTGTWCATIALPVPFCKVRLISQCLDGTPGTIASAIIAPTASTTDLATPTVGGTKTNDAGATGWSDVTWSSSTSTTLPTAGSDPNDSGLLYSDWIDCDSVAANDGTGNYYLMIRQRHTGNYSYWYLESTNANAAYINTSRSSLHLSSYFNGDATTTPATVTSGMINRDVNSTIFGVEVMVDQRIMRVLVLGDSISMGSYDDGGTYSESAYGWVGRCNDYFRINSIPINVINHAWSSKTTAQYYTWGRRAVSTFLPSVAIYSVFSPNDGTPTQAIVNTQYRRAMDFAKYCLSLGTLPVFSFLTGADSYTLTQDNFRKSLITRIKASGFYVIDTNPIIGDGASPQKYQTAYYYDGVHPNTAGYTAMAPVFEAALLDIYQSNVSA